MQFWRVSPSKRPALIVMANLHVPHGECLSGSSIILYTLPIKHLCPAIYPYASRCKPATMDGNINQVLQEVRSTVDLYFPEEKVGQHKSSIYCHSLATARIMTLM